MLERLANGPELRPHVDLTPLPLSGSAAPHFALLEGLNEGIIVTDLADVVLYCNPALLDLTGYLRDELVGRRAYEVLLPPAQWGWMQERNLHRQQGLSETYEAQILRKDGTPCWFETRASPLRDAAGVVVGTLSANIDITQRIEAEHALRQAAILQERQRLAREMHDTVAQAFTGITVQLGAAERVLNTDPAAAREHLLRARELAREGLTESRRSVWALRSDALEGNSLCEAFMHLRDQMTGGLEVSLDFRIEGVARALPPEVALNLLRIGQEALTNAVKHARAKRITMKLTFLDEQVGLSVEDDGEGFEQAALVQRRGFGLLGIRERSDRIGGRLRIESGLSAGTRVAVVVPLPGDSTHGGADE